MGERPVTWAGGVLALTGALLVAACGGGEATPVSQPTAAPRPSATAAPSGAPTPTLRATAVPSPPAPTATAVPATTPTPRPVAPVGKRGGILQVHILQGQPFDYDTYVAGGPAQAGHEVWQPVFNNLIQPDPYGDGKTLVGDAAERWDFSQDGKVLTFFLRKGINFHDGVPLTAKDVAYNIDRTRSPRGPQPMHYRAQLQVVDKIETPDDYTVRLTLTRLSNALLRVLATNTMTVYPSHFPFPEKKDEFRKNPIGSGPFKVKSVDPGARVELLRNDTYWKPGLPYLDGINLTVMAREIYVAALQTGRIDVASLLIIALTPTLVKSLQRDRGFVPQRVTTGPIFIHLNQRPPWTDERARAAFSLALDRQAIVDLALEGEGTGYAPPLLPPELGGQWGLSIDVMKSRPGYRADKTQDLARAKALLAEAGISPAQVTVTIAASISPPLWYETIDPALRALGFKTDIKVESTVDSASRLQRGDFDIFPGSASITFDDPLDFLANYALSTGSLNYGKWSNPEIDRLMREQDAVLDVPKRKQMLVDVQNIILDQYFGAVIPSVYRYGFMGYMPWVKNYYPNLPFLHSPRMRWEQVWLER